MDRTEKTYVGAGYNPDTTALTYLENITRLPLGEGEEAPEGSLIWALQQTAKEVWAPEIAEAKINEMINASNIPDEEKRRLVKEAHRIIEENKTS